MVQSPISLILIGPQAGLNKGETKNACKNA